jgi:hypothetical protein
MVLYTEKRVFRANDKIYTPAAYVVTFARLYSYEIYDVTNMANVYLVTRFTRI